MPRAKYLVNWSESEKIRSGPTGGGPNPCRSPAARWPLGRERSPLDTMEKLLQVAPRKTVLDDLGNHLVLMAGPEMIGPSHRLANSGLLREKESNTAVSIALPTAPALSRSPEIMMNVGCFPLLQRRGSPQPVAAVRLARSPLAFLCKEALPKHHRWTRKNIRPRPIRFLNLHRARLSSGQGPLKNFVAFLAHPWSASPSLLPTPRKLNLRVSKTALGQGERHRQNHVVVHVSAAQGVGVANHYTGKGVGVTLGQGHDAFQSQCPWIGTRSRSDA